MFLELMFGYPKAKTTNYFFISMRLLIYIILILKINLVFSQEKTFIICDNNKEKISFANIVLDKKKCIGTTTNIDGVIKINIEQNYDTVEISCIGYKTAKLAWKDFILKDSIFLTKDFFQLSTVTITSKKNKIITVGSSKVKGYPGYMYDIAGSEIALYIKPNNKTINKTIKNIQVYVSKRGVPNSNFRIILYSVSNQNNRIKPDTILLNQNLINQAIKGNEWVNFDILKYNLKMPAKGIFVSIMWLNSSEKFISSFKKNNIELCGQVIKAVCSDNTEKKKFYNDYVWSRNILFDNKWKKQESLMLPLVKCNLIY